MRLIRALVVLGLAAMSMTVAAEPAVAAKKVSVVAAFYPVAYAVERVGGEQVSVTNLTPAGAER